MNFIQYGSHGNNNKYFLQYTEGGDQFVKTFSIPAAEVDETNAIFFGCNF